MDNQNNRSNKNNPKNNRQGWGVILVTTLLTAFLVMGLFSLMQGSDPQEISYDKFLKMVDEKKVEKVTIDSAKIYITLTDEARKEAIKKNQEENTATGQLWGNPLYKWDYHKKTGYEWWISRMKHCFELYDVVRIDHFRGFDEYYSIPYGNETAIGGHWEKGPGIELFRAIEKALGKKDVIAEDLGFMTNSVRQ